MNWFADVCATFTFVVLNEISLLSAFVSNSCTTNFYFIRPAFSLDITNIIRPYLSLSDTYSNTSYLLMIPGPSNDTKTRHFQQINHRYFTIRTRQCQLVEIIGLYTARHPYLLFDLLQRSVIIRFPAAVLASRMRTVDQSRGYSSVITYSCLCLCFTAPTAARPPPQYK